MNTIPTPFTIRALELIAFLIVLNAGAQTGTWVPHGPFTNWTSVACSADGTKLVATAHLGLYTSADSGATWTTRESLKYWTTADSSSDGTKLVAGADDLYTSPDSGATWINHSLYSAFVQVACSADGSQIVAIEQGGSSGNQLLFSTNTGTNWTLVSSGLASGYFSSDACSSNGVTMIAAVHGSEIYIKTNTLNAWHLVGPSNYWSGVACSADGTKIVAVANPGQIYTSTNSGQTWTARDSSRNWNCVASSADGTQLVAAVGGGSGGQIYISIDSGVTWTPTGTNLYWTTVASSADGMKLAAAAYGSQIYTYLAPVANDQCSGAIALTPGVNYTMDTTYATSTGDPSPSCAPYFGKGVWFTYTAPGNEPVQISTCGSSFDTVLQIYSGTCGSLTPVTCDDDNGPACSGDRASVSFSAAAGTTYYILVGGYNNADGTLQIAAQVLNDQCAGAIALVNGVDYFMSTSDATSTGDPTPSCGSGVGKAVWFTFTPSINGVVEAYTCGSSFDTVVQVYSGSCGSLTPVAGGCNDDSSYCFPDHSTSYVSFAGTAGTTYCIMVGGYNGDSGNLDMVADVVPVLITSQPSGGTANAGDFYTFSVSATGPGSLTYQWLINSNSLANATNSTLSLTNLYPGNAGNYQVLVSNAYGGSVTSSVATLYVLPALDLAVDTTNLTWITGGGDNGYGWFRQTDVSHDSVDSAECSPPPPVFPFTSAYMQTTVTGPATVSFYWKFYKSIGSRSGDYLGAFMDETYQVGIASPFVTWSHQTIYVGTGSHTLSWQYVRAGTVHGGGPGYLDQVSVASGATPAFITTQPTPQTTVAGSNATFTVGGSGTPPFTYQWLFNGTAIANATNSSLMLTNVQPIQGSNYSVIVANGYGSPVTSSIVTLTMTTVPLPVALDYAGPVWSTSGNAAWFGEIGVTHDGVDAAQSGWLTNSQVATLTAELIGPGNLSFWWKVSSETNYDYLQFYTNGVRRAYISGEVDWQQQTFALLPGKQTVTWLYSKDISLSRGQDAGWVDQVTYDGPPSLSVTRLSQTQMILGWPYSATGYTLQMTTNLLAPVPWQTVTDPAVEAGDNWVVTNNISYGQLFYRLKK